MTDNAAETRVEYVVQEQVGFADQFVDVWARRLSDGEVAGETSAEAIAEAQRRAAHLGHTTRVRRHTTTAETVYTLVVRRTLTAYAGDPPDETPGA